jgi:hypothetical protein
MEQLGPTIRHPFLSASTEGEIMTSRCVVTGSDASFGADDPVFNLTSAAGTAKTHSWDENDVVCPFAHGDPAKDVETGTGSVSNSNIQSILMHAEVTYL